MILMNCQETLHLTVWFYCIKGKKNIFSLIQNLIWNDGLNSSQKFRVHYIFLGLVLGDEESKYPVLH